MGGALGVRDAFATIPPDGAALEGAAALLPTFMNVGVGAAELVPLCEGRSA